jgi:4-hydroxy-tetrahydrodipicolinate synthase
MRIFREIQGVLPVLHTPFTANDEIDAGTLKKEISWLIDLGVNGVTTGMVSEILKLSPSERMTLHDLVIEAVGVSGLTTVLSAGGESTKQAITYAKHAQESGADAIMVNPPLTSSLDDAALFDYFTAILDSTEIPLVVQDASGYIGRPLSLELQVKLFDEYEPRIYFKPEAVPIGPRLSVFMKATEGRARVLEGSGGLALIDTYDRGVVGTMPGADTAWALVAMWQALEAKNRSRAEAISGPLANLIALEHSLDAYLAVEKYLMVKQGIFTNENRREPIGYRLDEQTKTRIDEIFTSLHNCVFGGATP